ncbi:hypothetical protein Goe20_02360 [Bacillus phage vB_BsuM-Goe20]|nr:hypothetical protein Goe20_02360 [Bacillus phage vB_BsuM-Goe20]
MNNKINLSGVTNLEKWELDQLTTIADRLYADQEEQGHPDATVSYFLDSIVTLLEALGGRVEGVTYKEKK